MARCSHFLASVALVSLFTGAASAEPIVVNSGFILLTGPSEVGVVSISGTKGFSLGGGGVDTSEGGTAAFHSCSGFECLPGTRIDLQAGFGALAFAHNRLTVEGQEFILSGSVDGDIAMFLVFSGSMVIPPLDGRSAAQVTTPFSMDGLMFLSPFGPRHEMIGQGLVHVSLLEGPLLGGPDRGWMIDAIRWEFEHTEPVPEPGTLLLVASGAAVLARMRQRRRPTDMMRVDHRE